MSLTLAVNDRNDIFVATDGNLARHSDIAAVMQAAQHAAQTILAEMIYATDQGVPYLDIVWNGTPNLSQFDAFLRVAILGVDGVQQILALDVRAQGGEVNYSATIQTVYGTAILNG